MLGSNCQKCIKVSPWNYNFTSMNPVKEIISCLVMVWGGDTLLVFMILFFIKRRWGQTCPKLFFPTVFLLFCPAASNWLWLDRTSATCDSELGGLQWFYKNCLINNYYYYYYKQSNAGLLISIMKLQSVFFVCLFPVWCLKWKNRKNLLFLSLTS